MTTTSERPSATGTCPRSVDGNHVLSPLTAGEQAPR